MQAGLTLWILLAVVIATFLFLDLFVFHRDAHAVSFNGRFAYLKLGLAALLVFAGVKIIISDIYKMPVLLSLGVIVGILAVSIGYSLWKTRGLPPSQSATPADLTAH